jgi:pyridoxine kinase
MPRIIALSSFLARGSQGLNVIAPALQALGHEVIAFPTVVLSNHAGYAHVGGFRVAGNDLGRMAEAVERNGWLSDVAAILTGYLPGPDHVAFAAALVGRVRAARPECLYVCDPVLGDEPKGLYIDPDAAADIRDRLVPLANAVTPNLFELGWLTGRAISTAVEVSAAARALGVPSVFVTSVPGGDARTGVALVGPDFTGAVFHPKQSRVANGTGDLFAGLVTGHLANGRSARDALREVAGTLARLVEASAGRDALALPVANEAWIAADMSRVEPLV